MDCCTYVFVFSGGRVGQERRGIQLLLEFSALPHQDRKREAGFSLVIKLHLGQPHPNPFFMRCVAICHGASIHTYTWTHRDGLQRNACKMHPCGAVVRTSDIECSRWTLDVVRDRPSKRRKVFTWLKKMKYDIHLLQETRSTSRDANLRLNEWGGEGVFAQRERSCGVGVLVKPGSGIVLSEAHQC